MARIRTIKPEFPHSESMGRVSRDARLTFILLWTLADDAGRLRGNSRMLASLLFPYDDDAHDGIEKWLGELETQGCIKQYEVENSSYVEVANWRAHQKIDRPSTSKLPAHEPSRDIASPRDDSSEDRRIKGSKDQDQGPGSKDQDRSMSTASTDTDDVVLVFDHWRETFSHPNALLDPKRQTRIRDALKKFSSQQLRDAISGYAHSPHHTGKDPKGNGVKYDDIELLLRDAKHVETGIEFLANPPRRKTLDEPKNPYRNAI